MRRIIRHLGMTLAMTTATGLIGAMQARAQDMGGPAYTFLKAVKDRDGAKATEALNKPGNTMIMVRDEKGEDALHIVTKRRDLVWMQFMLSKGAPMDARDHDGNTALMDAAQIGFAEGIQLLLQVGANVDLANDRGETPLVIATQAHDLASVRLLVQYGADPSITDHVAGLSAMDYAKRDPRAAPILKILQGAKPKPKHQAAGPSLN